MDWMHKYIPNIITLSRIITTIGLLFVNVISTEFWILYVYSGLSDVLDGFVARKTNAVSILGSRLDTVADFLFIVVCLFKFCPILNIPEWLIVWVAAIGFFKIANVITYRLLSNKWVCLHTIPNKVIGVFLFLLPFTIGKIFFNYYIVFVSIFASVIVIFEMIKCFRS